MMHPRHSSTSPYPTKAKVSMEIVGTASRPMERTYEWTRDAETANQCHVAYIEKYMHSWQAIVGLAMKSILRSIYRLD